MDLAETIYQRLHGTLRRLSYSSKAKLERVCLEELRLRLALLASAISGRKMEICAVSGLGAYSDTQIFLPEHMDRFANQVYNHNFYFFRTAFCAVASLWQNASTLKVLIYLAKRMPMVYAQGMDLARQLEPGESRLLLGEGYLSPQSSSFSSIQKWQSDDSQDDAPKTKLSERQINVALEQKTVEFDRQKVEDYCLQHHFEKIETAEEFNGNWRLPDGEDQLDEHSQALDEIRFDTMVRLDSPVHALTSSTMRLNTTAAEVADAPGEKESSEFLYDEWDARKRAYRKDWCRVFERVPPVGTGSVPINHNSKNKLIRELLRLRNQKRIIPRQVDGEHLDIDAAIDAMVDIKTRRTPEEKIYQTGRARDPGLSVLLLLDLSLSTDSYISGQRIMDLIQKAATLAGEVFSACGIEFEIAGFRSRTRHECNYVILHRFGEDFKGSKSRIASVRPEQYTRIGPAIRHSVSRLRRVDTARKALLILTDAKPSDYDPYEGVYGLRDVARAMMEARLEGINLHSLTLHEDAMAKLDGLMGKREYELVRDGNDLIAAMVRWLRKFL